MKAETEVNGLCDDEEGGRTMAQQSRRTAYDREEARARYEERRRQEKAAEEARRAKIRWRQEKLEESHQLARGPIDLPFCLLVLLLTAIGLIMLLSASFPSAYYEARTNNDPLYYFVRQGIFAVAGIAAMFFIGKINYQRFRGAAKFLMFIAIVLLVLVIVPGVGETRNNATRWLGVGDLFTFQPSEIAKVAVVVYFSDSISRKKDKMHSKITESKDKGREPCVPCPFCVHQSNSQFDYRFDTYMLKNNTGSN